ncbi:hypothetical protein SUNI508_04496 [Seiridium unicorne]|uniref:Uncharacterized protein n=1 Tax=Seiridium unicorne TaxID=138068 RepID=A0ABR2V8G4_9PEZI
MTNGKQPNVSEVVRDGLKIGPRAKVKKKKKRKKQVYRFNSFEVLFHVGALGWWWCLMMLMGDGAMAPNLSVGQCSVEGRGLKSTAKPSPLDGKGRLTATMHGG